MSTTKTDRTDGFAEAPERTEQFKVSPSEAHSGLAFHLVAAAANDLGLRGFKMRGVSGPPVAFPAIEMRFVIEGDKVTLLKKGKTGLRPEMETFAAACERVMRDRDPDEGDSWREETLDELRFQLQHQLADLSKAFMAGSPEKVRKQCADLGNFAMMIHARADEVK